MQTRYKEKTVAAGDMLFVAVYAQHRKAGARRGKFRETSEVQAKNNERRSREYLTWLIHCNFDKTGMIVHLTYADGWYPESEARFEKDVRNYLARLGRIYRKAGAEFKWVCVRAFGEKGRCHVHLYCSGGVDRETVEAAWGMGRANVERLQFNACGVVDLSRYTWNQRHAGKRRWSGSRNLDKPVEKTDMTRYSAAALREIAECGNPHKIFADRYPGYWLAEFPSVEKNEVNGSLYMTAVLYRPDSANLEGYARERRRKA